MDKMIYNGWKDHDHQNTCFWTKIRLLRHNSDQTITSCLESDGKLQVFLPHVILNNNARWMCENIISLLCIIGYKVSLFLFLVWKQSPPATGTSQLGCVVLKPVFGRSLLFPDFPSFPFHPLFVSVNQLVSQSLSLHLCLSSTHKHTHTPIAQVPWGQLLSLPIQPCFCSPWIQRETWWIMNRAVKGAGGGGGWSAGQRGSEGERPFRTGTRWRDGGRATC